MVDPVRIRSTWLKVGFIALYFVVATSVGRLMAEWGVVGLAATLVLNLVWIAAIIAGARTFRVEEEDPVPPRPWWQMTGRPTAGFVLASLLIATDITLWVAAALGTVPVDPLASIVNSAFTVAVAVLYVRSSLLLKSYRSGRPSPP